MVAAISMIEARSIIQSMFEDDVPNYEVQAYLEEQGFTSEQIHHLTNDPVEKRKNQEIDMTQQTHTTSNPLEEMFSNFLNISVTYGVPVMLFLFGAAYVWGEVTRDMEIGVRSLAAVLLPLTVTFALRKSDLGTSVSRLFSRNRLLSFGFAFAFAMSTMAAAMVLRQHNNVVPLGELAFSATFSLLIFGTNRENGDVSFLHIGAVSGFLTYIILFGLAI